ncbi:hypothetical protein RM780_26530 [Streptomyces sp. DSM 44917]|uniref:Large membrane protein n=1 Tax=Streptomyces boetiae TaxID=3075541 RepID=A0ABU2LGU4_9ACTN|nr:hypothetical protein [Streptomyces sp. DSM 44917]MDT0310477.1 hypothetical protein [Streptomyces sp. DSM 44917]
MADDETPETPEVPGEAASPGPQDPERGAGRRRWALVTAVAVAVAAIGGGVYAVAGPGGGGASPAAAEELVLEGPVVAPLGDGSAEEAQLADVAGWSELRLTGEVPAAPERAGVRGLGEVSRERAQELAAALGLPGEVAGGSDGGWTVASEDAVSLTVQREAPGHWSYGGMAYSELEPAPDGGGAGAAPGSEGGGDSAGAPADGTTYELAVPDGPDGSVSSEDAERPDADGREAPSEEEARAAAGPVLEALGLEGDRAEVTVVATGGAERVVRATPVVDGLPAHGLETELYVGPGGRVTGAWGALARPDEGEDAEVTLTAEEALAEYNAWAAAGPRPEPAIACVPEEVADCPLPAPLLPLEVTAGFGLELHHADGEAVLVPSWLFLPAGDAGTSRARYVAGHPAVPFRYEEPGADGDPGADDPRSAPAELPDSGPADAREEGEEGGGTEEAAPEGAQRTGWSVAPYDPEDRTLTVRFYGGVCETYEATARETADAVHLGVETAGSDPGEVCILIAQEQTAEVELEEPVGDRELLDPAGEAIPVA